jgi:pyocin large subunit-like protein
MIAIKGISIGTLKIRAVYLFLALVCLFAVSCSKEEASTSVPAQTYTGYSSSVTAGDFAPGQLQAHYQKHGYQFGNITQEQYLQGARELLDAPVGNEVLEKRRSNGDILRYRPSTAEFAVKATDGRIRTYFKADYQYWLRQ